MAGWFVNKNDLNSALTNNPSLNSSPGLAVTVAKSSNPNVTAQTLAHAANMTSLQRAAQDHVVDSPVAHHWYDGVVHAVANTAELLMKPLHEVQKDYKYIHSLYTRHGIFVGTLGALAVAGGTALGALAGPEGALLGGELAAAGLRHIGGHLSQFGDSFQDSENDSYKVSMGRDVANALGAHGQTDSGWGKFVSGAVDAGSWLALDPLMKVGAISRSVRMGEYLNTSSKAAPVLLRGAGAQSFLTRNSIQVSSLNQLDNIYRAGQTGSIGSKYYTVASQYQRTLNELHKIVSSAGSTAEASGEILVRFPELQGVATDLAKTKNVDGLHRVIAESFFDVEKMQEGAVGGSALVPVRSIGRTALSSTAAKLRQPFADSLGSPEAWNYRNAANFIAPRNVFNKEPMILPVILNPSKQAFASAMSKKVRTFTGYQPFTIDSGTLNLSTKVFDPMDPASAQGVYRTLRYSMGDRLAQKYTGEFMEAVKGGDLAEARKIWTTGQIDMLKAAGLPNDDKMVSLIEERIRATTEGSLGSGTYAHGFESQAGANMVHLNDSTVTAGVHSHQAGMWSYPDFREVKLAMRSMGNVGKIYGNVDEFVAKNWTDSIFKPLALLTGGFGLRVAASELIPTLVRFGAVNTLESKVVGSTAKIEYGLARKRVQEVAKGLDYTLAKGEEDHILAHAALQLSGNHTVYTSLRYTKGLAKAKAEQLGEHFANEAIAAGEQGKFLQEQAEQVAGQTVRKNIAKGLSKIASEQDLDLAARIAIATRGHMATGATLSGHGLDVDFAEKQKQLMDFLGQHVVERKIANPGKFLTYTAHDDHFMVHWVTNLQKASQNKPSQMIMGDVLDAMRSGKSEAEAWSEAVFREQARMNGVAYDPSAFDKMGSKLPKADDTHAVERKVLSRYKTQESYDFAYARVDDLRNTVTGVDGTMHEPFMRMVANGHKPQLADVKDIESVKMPLAQIGPEMKDYIGGNLVQRITQSGFSKVIDPIVGNISRQPLFFQHVKQEMKLYQPLIDSGEITADTGLRLAMTRATQAMVPQIHNVALRTQFSIMARNFLPFYFAQEQATRRFIKLGTENPEAFRMYQLIEHALNDPGFVQEDGQGNRYITFPVVGEVGIGAMNAASKLGLPVVGNLPISVRGNTESLKTVLPEATMPGLSPFANIALNSISSLFPQLARPTKSLTGRGFGNSVIDSLIPNAPARAWFKALSANEQDTTFHSAMLSALAAANYHNQLPDVDSSPAEKQAFLDRIKNNARSILVIKGLLATVAPLAPQVSQEDLGLRDEWYKLVASKGDYGSALQEFLGKHGDNAISYTVGRSEGVIKGASMPYTSETADWIETNKDLMKSKFAVGVAFLVPQGTKGGDSQAVRDELFKMGLRESVTPQQFQEAIYTATGNNQYFDAKALHDEAIANNVNNKEYVKQENAHWSEFVTSMKLANPVWADDFESPEKRNIAAKAIQDLDHLFSTGLAPAGKQSESVLSLLQDFKTHEQAKAQIRNNFVSGATLTDENDNWSTYLDNLAKQKPELQTIINGVFRRLP